MSHLSNNDNILNETASEAPQLCRECCEFFGTKHTDFLCSSCFKKNAKSQESVKEALGKVVPQPSNHIQSTAPNSQEVSRKTSAEEEEKAEAEVKPIVVEPEVKLVAAEPEKPKEKNKCSQCSKKIGVLGFPCKCGGAYCRAHRLPEDHDCEHDFKQEAKAKLAKENPLIQASKLDKI